MSASIIDLRSDTVTKPSPAMREIMADAAVGDDVYGEDPSINELEALAAEMTGKEAGLYVPAGCMANLIAQKLYVTPGNELIAAMESHCVAHESGSGAALGGVQYSLIPDYLFTADQVEERIMVEDLHEPGTDLVWVENTHNMGGGLVYPLKQLAAISRLCRERKIPLHLDGARVFNAAAALGVDVKEITQHVDSLSFCLSKGLGAPVGSVMCLPAELRPKALRLRKMLGGAMRQAGILAAAGSYALKNNVARLAEDHEKARFLAHTLAQVDGLAINLDDAQSNIVMATVTKMDAARFVNRCEEAGVLFHSLSKLKVRFVTHLDISMDEVGEACGRIEGVLAG